jgi:hypothetical protein
MRCEVQDQSGLHEEETGEGEKDKDAEMGPGVLAA